MKGLFLRGSVWWMRFTVRGKHYQRSTKTEDKKRAKRIFDKVKGQIAEGKWFEKVPGEEKTFKEFVEKWLMGKVRIKKATQVSYEGIVNNHLVPHFGARKMGDLRRDDLKDFVKALVDGEELSPKSIHNILLVLHQMLDDAQIEGMVTQNPYIKIEKPRREKAEVDYLRTHEIPVFLKAARTYREPKEKVSKITDKPEKEKEHPRCETTIHALFYTDIFTGMRRGELLALKWSDIDWVNEKIRVRRSLYKKTFQSPKSEYSKRDIDMGPRLIQVLKEHRAKQNETRLKVGSRWSNLDLVFSDNEGNAIDPDNLYHRDFKAVLKKAGLREIRIHDLRHTFASILIAAGHNLKYIQNQMGHSSIQVTMDLYGHLMPEVYQGAAKKSEDFVYANAKSPEFVQNYTSNEKGVTANSATP